MSAGEARAWRFCIDDDTVWSIIRDDVPAILPRLEAIQRHHVP